MKFERIKFIASILFFFVQFFFGNSFAEVLNQDSNVTIQWNIQTNGNACNGSRTKLIAIYTVSTHPPADVYNAIYKNTTGGCGGFGCTDGHPDYSHTNSFTLYSVPAGTNISHIRTVAGYFNNQGANCSPAPTGYCYNTHVYSMTFDFSSAKCGQWVQNTAFLTKECGILPTSTVSIKYEPIGGCPPTLPTPTPTPTNTPTPTPSESPTPTPTNTPTPTPGVSCPVGCVHDGSQCIQYGGCTDTTALNGLNSYPEVGAHGVSHSQGTAADPIRIACSFPGVGPSANPNTEPPVLGCTYKAAINYNPSATREAPVGHPDRCIFPNRKWKKIACP